MKRLSLFIIIAFVFFLTFLIYSPSFYAPFQLDDYPVFVHNPIIQNLNNPAGIWRYDPSRFLTHMTLSLNFYNSGLNVLGYHMVNFLLHMFVACFVYFFIFLTVSRKEFEAKLTYGQRHLFSLTTALIFLTHPIQTSTVTYLAQRATLLAALFYLIALVAYILYRREDKIKFYVPAIMASILGGFCKPIVVTLPLAICLYEVFFLSRRFIPSRKTMAGWIPFILSAFMIPCLLMLWKYRSLDMTRWEQVTFLTQDISRQEYLLTQFNVLATYLRLILVPVDQNLDYDYPLAVNFFSFPTWASFGVLTLFLILGIRLKQKQPLISFGIFWFFFTLSLESSIFPMEDVIFEHRLYLPMVGLSIAMTMTIFSLIRHRVLRAAFIMTILLVWATMTYHRNIIWSDRFLFLKDALLKSPGKSRIYNSLGLAYAEHSFYAQALIAFNQAIVKDPNDLKPYNNRANVYRLKKKYDLALKDYNRVLELDANFAMGYFYRSLTLAALHDYQSAIQDAIKAKTLGYPYMDTYIAHLQGLTQ